jgi:NhaA family Na+:H+ antiporter
MAAIYRHVAPMVKSPRPLSTLRRLLTSEAAGGLILMGSAALALAAANSPWAATYFSALHIGFAGLDALHWINDGLMAIFFLLVGLEIKRELLDGELATWRARALPGMAALGGMIAPALVYIVINIQSPDTLRGWAIPSATDIAFSLGILALLRARVPLSLKIFLTALAILDDLGAIIIIALFYGHDVSVPMLASAAAVTAVLVLLNFRGVTILWPYLLLGLVLWFCVFRSGIHATVAGVVLAATIPVRHGTGTARAIPSPLHRLENALQRPVAFVVLPIFGFANAGVSLAAFDGTHLLNPVTLGCALGLFVGKQLGVFGAIWIAERLKLAKRPSHTSWVQVYGLALLCGIGFTMSLFIGVLAFENQPQLEEATKVGVLVGSLLSAVCGWTVLRLAHHPDELRVGGK